jgi:hypothetical protein
MHHQVCCLFGVLQLRFNKVSELIHNSTNFRNLDQARVTVFFQEIIDKVHRPSAARACAEMAELGGSRMRPTNGHRADATVNATAGASTERWLMQTLHNSRMLLDDAGRGGL